MLADSLQLTAVFRAAAPDVAPPAEGELRRWVDTAAAAWPGIDVPIADFVAHIARYVAADAPTEPNVVDLYLAYACAIGNARAVATLDSRHLADVAKGIWQVEEGERDDVLQRVRELLLVHGRNGPLIARYAGRGSLRGWIRAIAMRTAIKHARGTHRLVPLDEQGFLEIAASSDDPTLDPYRQRYRDEFRASFGAAVATLTVRQRNLLRHYFIDHMTIDEIGALYRVHRATAARWIQDVRTELVAAVRAALRSRLGNEVGLHTMIELVASQLELSLERLVGDDA